MTSPTRPYAEESFAEALADLLRREQGDPLGRIRLSDFFKRVEGWEYETLRKQVVSERKLQPEAIEAMAQALAVQPEYFIEYRRHQIERAITVHPELVDLVYDLLVTRAKSFEAMVAPTVTHALELMVNGQDLDLDLACKVLELIVQGQVGDVQAAAFLSVLRARGETSEQLVGLARALRRTGERVEVNVAEPLVDIASAGGGIDYPVTFNISTVAALVAAGAGVRVAKHGNRGQTSQAGAAELMEALGARIDLGPAALAHSIEQLNFAFLFSPMHYPVVRHLASIRRSLGIRTIFSFLGPLSNPAGAKRQLTGVCERKYVRLLAQALLRLGSEHALVVHGANGLDEISVVAPTTVVEVRDGEISEEFVITPEDLGLPRHAPPSMEGGDPARNAVMAKRVLSGEPGAALDVVLANAGAAIYLSGLASSIAEGVEQARTAVHSGRAWDTMTNYVEFTKQADRYPLEVSV